MLKFILVTALLMMSFAQNVQACSCAGWPSTCGSYQMAQAVFIGTVRSVNNTKAKDEDNREWIVGQTASVQVEKVFKGSVKPEVVFKSFGSSCDAQYVEGQRWLLYAKYDPKEKAWVVGGCDRSTLVEFAADDLLYLQGLPKSGEKTRISGHLSLYTDLPEKETGTVTNLLGIKIKLKANDKTYEAYTDKNGTYEIYGLPPGLYSATAEVPIGMKLKYSSIAGPREIVKEKQPDGTMVMEARARLVEKGCVSIDFSLSADNAISGRVLGRNGQPMPRICLDLLRVSTDEKAKDSASRIFDCTEPDGSYSLTDIPPGKYVIVVNKEGTISSEEPFPATYYPGTNERNKATEITMGLGDIRKDYDIQLPTQSERRTLSGVVTFSDGRPAAETWVVFVPHGAAEGADSEARVSTDANGRFELPVLVGLKGNLHATFFAPENEYPCQETQKWVKANGTSFIESKSLPVEVAHDIADISFVLPVRYCQKVKRQ